MTDRSVIGQVMDDDEGQYVVLPDGCTLDATEFEVSQSEDTLILTPIRAVLAKRKSGQPS